VQLGQTFVSVTLVMKHIEKVWSIVVEAFNLKGSKI